MDNFKMLRLEIELEFECNNVYECNNSSEGSS